MTKEAPDPTLHFGNLVSAYTDSIRVSDFKSNLTVLFVAIMMGPIVAERDKYPHFLPLPIILTPFLVSFLCLLFCVMPRYSRGPWKNNFLLVRNPKKSDFVFVEDSGDEVEQLRVRCAILCRILYWKTFFLLNAIYICLGTMIVIFVLLTYSLFEPIS
jgi:hypothetical protein